MNDHALLRSKSNQNSSWNKLTMRIYIEEKDGIELINDAEFLSSVLRMSE